MAKSLNDVLKGVNQSKVVPGSTGDDPGVDYAGKMKDERDFVAQHKVEKHADRVGNDDDVYNASKVKKAKMERHGHDPDPKSKTIYKQANEAKDSREYGYEGEMAMSQIKSIMNHGEQLMKMLKPDTDMPEWVQSKITLANDYIQTAADYFATEMSEEVEVIDEGGSQYRSPAGSGKNTNPNLSKLARKLSFEKPRSFRQPGERSRAEKKAEAEALTKDYLAKGGKIRKEEIEIEEQKKCNMTEAGTMCEVHGMKACDSKEEKSATDKEPRYNGKKKEGRQLITDKKKIDEREMTAAEKKKETKLKSKYDDSSMKASMQKQYGAEKGKQVYFAYIRKKAMNKEQADTHISTPSTIPGDTGRV